MLKKLILLFKISKFKSLYLLPILQESKKNMSNLKTILDISYHPIFKNLPHIKKIIALDSENFMLVDQGHNFYIMNTEIQDDNIHDKIPNSYLLRSFSDIYDSLRDDLKLRKNPLKYLCIKGLDDFNIILKYPNSNIFIYNLYDEKIHSILYHTTRAKKIFILDKDTIIYQTSNICDRYHTYVLRIKSKKIKILHMLSTNMIDKVVLIHSPIIALQIMNSAICIFNMANNTLIKQMRNEGISRVQLITYPQMNVLLTADLYEGNLKFWDTKDLIMSIKNKKDKIGEISLLQYTSIAETMKYIQKISPDKFAIINDRVIRFYMINQNKPKIIATTKIDYNTEEYYKTYNLCLALTSKDIIITQRILKPINQIESYTNHNAIQLYDTISLYEEVNLLNFNESNAVSNSKLYKFSHNIIVGFDLVIATGMMEPYLIYIVDNKGGILLYDSQERKILKTMMLFGMHIEFDSLQEFQILPMGFILGISNNENDASHKLFSIYNPMAMMKVLDSFHSLFESVTSINFIKYIEDDLLLLQYHKNNDWDIQNKLAVVNIHTCISRDIFDLYENDVMLAFRIDGDIFLLLIKNRIQNPNSKLLFINIKTGKVILRASGTIFHVMPINKDRIAISFNSRYIYLYNWKKKSFEAKIQVNGIYEFLCTFDGILFFSYIIRREVEYENESENDREDDNEDIINVNYINFKLKNRKTHPLPLREITTSKNIFKVYPQIKTIVFHDRVNRPGGLHFLKIINRNLFMIKVIKNQLSKKFAKFIIDEIVELLITKKNLAADTDETNPNLILINESFH